MTEALRHIGAELSEQERTDLLDWVSTCQSSYAMTQTGHRFASQPNFLKENRAGLVEYVNQCLRSRAATSQAQAAEGSKPRQDAGQQLIAERGLFLKEFGDRKEAAELFDARWDAWLARAGIATNCKHPDAACSIGPTTDQRNWYCPACRVSWVTFPTDEERRAAVRGQS